MKALSNLESPQMIRGVSGKGAPEQRWKTPPDILLASPWSGSRTSVCVITLGVQLLGFCYEGYVETWEIKSVFL